MATFSFDPFGDYKKQFREYSAALYMTGLKYPIKKRKELIKQLTDSYVEAVGEAPDGRELEKLSNWLLLDYLSSSKRNKTKQKNPFLSKRQILRRKAYERRLNNNL